MSENTERDELAVKIRWASKKSITAEQARDAAEAVLGAGYRKFCAEAVGDIETIGPETTRVGEMINHRGVIYTRAATK